MLVQDQLVALCIYLVKFMLQVVKYKHHMISLILLSSLEEDNKYNTYTQLYRGFQKITKSHIFHCIRIT